MRSNTSEIPQERLRDVLRAAALYASTYAGKDIVVKFGAEVYRDKQALADVITANVTLKQLGSNILTMHGGGSYIDDALKEKNLFLDKINGVRPTTEAGLTVATDVLRTINMDIVLSTNRIARELQIDDKEILGQGEGGWNGGYIKAVRETEEPIFGEEKTFTGKNPVADSHKLATFRNQSVIPYFYSICAGSDSLLNVNADDAAAAMAEAIKAERLLLCSDVPGVMDLTGVMGLKRNILDSIFTDQVAALTGKLPGVEALDSDEREKFERMVIIKGGMIPKIESGAAMADKGAGVVILKGESILTELFTKSGGGTLISARPKGKRNEVDDYLDRISLEIPGLLPQRRLG